MTRLARDPGGPAVSFGHTAHDGQADAEARRYPRGPDRPGETLEQIFLGFSRDAGARVAHVEADGSTLLTARDDDLAAAW